MDRKIEWIVGASLALLAAAPRPALGQGAATDGAVTLTYPATHWSANPLAGLQGTEPNPATDFVYELGWWYRAEGDTREYPLPAPDSQSYAGGVVNATWNDLDGKGFRVTEYTFVFDNEGPSGGLWSFLQVTNNNAVPRSFAIFHYADPDLAGTSGTDSGSLLAPRYVRLADGATVVRYRSSNATHYQVEAYSGLRALLNDAAVTDLDDTGLPFGPGDVTAAFERELTLQPGATFSLEVSLSSRLPSDHVEAAFHDLTTFPVLLWRSPGGYVEQAMRRTTLLGINFSAGLPAGQELVDLDDFDGDFEDETLSRDPLTGETRVGNQIVTGAAGPPPNWKASATGDWNADGNADILWRNTSSQKLAVWLMDGNARIGAVAPTPDQATNANWEVAGSADFDADGFRDVLWYNQTSGNVVIWYMDAALQRITGAFTTPASVGNNNWRVVAVGDYGRGAGGVADSADIVWQNDASFKLVVWHMDHAGVRTSGTFTTPDSIGPNVVVVGPR